ncbi:MAG TPA: MipA/OmpV family protein [Burkholderiaceae bacterium]|nr:MipA/OmpV family protein [Burkholderiaceae bacterium]
MRNPQPLTRPRHFLRISSLRACLAAGALIAAAGGAHAQAFDAVRLFGVPAGAGEGLVGVAAISSPAYQGSDERRLRGYPILDYRWTNGWFVGTGNGAGYNFSRNPQWQYGARVTVDLGRKEHRSPALAGMGDVPVRPEIGGFLNYFINDRAFLTSSLRYGAGEDHDGAIVDLGAGYALPIAAQWRAAFGVAASLVNGAYMRNYFGVSPAQSARTGYAVHEPGAGVRDVRATASITYYLTSEWSFTALAGVSQLQGDAKDSPITRERNGVNGVLAASYLF